MKHSDTDPEHTPLSHVSALDPGTCSLKQFFFSEDPPEGARNIRPVYPEVDKHGVVLEATEDWEFRNTSSFASSIVRLDNGRFRMYYTCYGASKLDPDSRRRMGIAVAESDDGLSWEKTMLDQDKGTNRVVFENLSEPQDTCGQPQVIRTADGGWLMYFWKHGTGHLRYTIAESKDGLKWRVIDFEKPAMYHPKDVAVKAEWAAGLSEDAMDKTTTVSKELAKRARALLTNDATFVYANPLSGLFETYSVWLVPSIPDRRVDVDNAPGVLRTIQRRTSVDGFEWSGPELLIWPDQSEPWDMQFYHLAVQWHDDWMIGSLGHYRVEDGQQTMDIELCFSREGTQWSRPLRGGFIPRGAAGERDCEGIYPPNAWIDRGDKWLCLYTGYARKHNDDYSDKPNTSIMAATFDKDRLLGMHAGTVTGGFLSEPFVLQTPELHIDADIKGWLRAELCDMFGRKLDGFHLKDSAVVTGNGTAHGLSWTGAELQPLLNTAMRVRFEFQNGAVYCLKQGET